VQYIYIYCLREDCTEPLENPGRYQNGKVYPGNFLNNFRTCCVISLVQCLD